MFRTRKRKWIAAGIAVAVVATAGVGLAAWIFTSTGDGSAKAGTFTAPSFTTVAAPTADLLPAATPTGTLSIQVNNPNDVALKLTQVEQGAAPIVSGNPAACSNSMVTFPLKGGLSIPVPAGSSRVDVPQAIKMIESAPVTCAGVVFTIPTKATWSTG